MVFAKIKDRLGQVVANDNGRNMEHGGGIAFTELRLQLCWDATKKPCGYIDEGISEVWV